MSKKVAIIGYAFRLPGTDRQQIWQDLCNGNDLISRVDDGRWDQARFLHPVKGHPACSYTFSAGSVGDVAGFDAGFFGISPREAASMDPQQRLMLELAWEAFEDAGMPPERLRGSACGVYFGVASTDYASRFAHDLAAVDASTATGTTVSILANRISYFYNLHGPSMAIDTACSSSLVAFHQACLAIAHGEIDMALTGGVSLHLHPYGFLIFAQASMLSPRGRCTPFDAAADGYVRAEGGGVFFLKEYDRAVADGDRILAVVAASGVNNDGRKNGLTVPSAEAQAELMARVCTKAGVNPEDIDYFEAHGTGTPVGDPIEAMALGTALGTKRPADKPLLIGSIKSNIGHLETAAGVAGLVKALLILQHRAVPPTIGIQTPNPAIDFKGLNLQLATEYTPLSPTGSLHVGINSFGFGGANAHVLLTSQVLPQGESVLPSSNLELPIVISARDQDALRSTAANLGSYLDKNSDQSLYDIAATLLFRREQLPWRAVVTGNDHHLLARELCGFAEGAAVPTVQHGMALGSPVGPVFVYVGNGAQWEGMGTELLQDATFAAAVAEVDTYFKPLAGFSLLDELAGMNGAGRYQFTEIAQPALFAVQVGITCMVRTLGIEPVAVAGHSVGEIAAAWACGALSLEDAVTVIFQRSRLQGLTKGLGRMTAVSASPQYVQQAIDQAQLPSLTIAGFNSSNGVTIAGSVAELEQFETLLKKQSLAYRRLDLDYAFHSSAMDGIRDELLQVLGAIQPAHGKLPFYSTVTGGHLDGSSLDAEYWWRNIREPVQFEQAISHSIGEGMNIFVSITPHAILRNYLHDILKVHGIEGRVIPTATRKDANPQRIRRAVAQVLVAGVPLNRHRLFPMPTRLIDLPHYPWQKERHWMQSTAESTRILDQHPAHPLLGYAVPMLSATWENRLDTGRFPLLADHVVGDAAVFSATGFVELLIAAAQQLHPTSVVAIEQVEIKAPLLLEQGITKVVRLTVDQTDNRVTVTSRRLLHDPPWQQHLSARLLPVGGHDLNRPCFTLPDREPDFTRQSHLVLTQQAGLFYGPAFQGIQQGWVNGRSACAQLEPPAGDDPVTAGLHLHPALLDCALQLVFQIIAAHLPDTLAASELGYLPVSMELIRFRSDMTAPVFAQADLTGRAPHSLTADVALYDGEGRPIVTIERVRFRRARLFKVTKGAVDFPAYHRFPMPLPGSAAAMPVFDLGQRVQSAVAKLAADTIANAELQRFAAELDPLLEELCNRFRRERAGTVREASADQDITTSELWNGLLAEYPEQYQLLLDLGRAGSHGIVLPERSIRSILRQILGAAGRATIGVHLQKLISALVAVCPAGSRLTVLEADTDEPLWLPYLCAGMDFERSDYCFTAATPEAADLAAVWREKYPSISLVGPAPHDLTAVKQVWLALCSCTFLSMHEAESLLQQVCTAMTPGGCMILIGLHPPRWFDFPGYPADAPQTMAWYGAVLQQLGLLQLSCTSLVDDTVGPWIMVVQKPLSRQEPQQQSTLSGNLLLLHDDDASAAAIVACCAESGIRCTPQRADLAALSGLTLDEPDAFSGVLFVAGADTGAGIFSQDSQLYQQRLTQRCSAAGLLASFLEQRQFQAPVWLVATGSAADVRTASGAGEAFEAISGSAFWCYGRTLMNEFSARDLRLLCLEGGLTSGGLQALVREIRCRDIEQEVIITPDGHRQVPRLVLEESLAKASKGPDLDLGYLTLGFAMPGQLRNLRWEQVNRRVPVGDELEIEVHATGLNFRDIMYSQGLITDEAVENGFAGATLGLECAGIVTAIGPEVDTMAVGDRVVAFGPASFGTRAYTRSSAASPIPANLGFEAAATIPVAFFTAWYALCHMGRLQPGEKVLIHGAAGGVGLAAIQIARHVGAEIYATAGSDEKRDFLRLLGITHIYDSRSLGFAEQLLVDTDTDGVDLVLNSLAGEAINSNLRVLKPFGRFLELGKRDFYDNTRIGLRPFRNNISYYGIDADQVMQLQPELTRSLFSTIMTLFAEGQLKPLPYTVFEADQVTDAFRHMQQSRQIGKVIVTYRNGMQNVHLQPSARRQLALPPDRTWLVTGGLGGFGLRTAQWLVAKGCRYLVLISRSGPAAPEAYEAIEAFERQGIRVHAAACDVTDRSALGAVLESVKRSFPPLQGIVHAAAVIEDGLIRNMDQGQLERVLAPKLLGALHLHALTATLPLDYFVLYSSATTLFGNPGQGNYVAANGGLEGLARLREAAGLPATVIRWGAIDDVGFLARNQKLKEALTGRLGGEAITAEHALNQLEQLLLHGLSGVGVLPLDWHALQRSLPTAGHRRYATLGAIGEGGAMEPSADLLQRLAELDGAALQLAVIDLLKQEVAQILRMQPEKIDAGRALQDMGLDSLMAVELIAALEGRFGINLPVMAVSDGPTIEKLATLVIDLLGGTDTPAPPETVESQVAQLARQHAAEVDAADIAAIAASVATGVTERMSE